MPSTEVSAYTVYPTGYAARTGATDMAAVNINPRDLREATEPTVTPIPEPVVTTVQTMHRLSPAEFASVEHCVFVDVDPRYRCTVHYGSTIYCTEEVVWWDRSARSSYARPIAPPDGLPDPIPAARAALAALGIEVQS